MRSRRARWLLVPVVAALCGCSALARLRDKLGFVSNAPAAKPSPVTGGGQPGQFPEYLVDAFPDSRFVRIDPQSPKLALAAEAVLTRDDPHHHRGPPRFSPDGRLVAYAEFGKEGNRLIIRKLDGVEIRRVNLDDETRAVAPDTSTTGSPRTAMTWAPSSDAFAYTHQTPLGAYEIRIADLAGSGRRVDGPPAAEGMLAWSPDGDRIAFVPATRLDEIWMVDTTTRKTSRFARAPGPIQSLSWSADSKRIVLAAGTSKHDVWVLDATHPSDATSFRAVTKWVFDDVSPSFSPDGQWIAFYSSFRPLGAGPGWSILVVSANGRDPEAGAALMDRMRDSNVEVHEGTPPPSWTPDAKWVAVVEPQSDEYHAIVFLDAAGGDRNELAPDSLTNEDVTVSADGVLAYRARHEWGDHIVLGLAARGATRVER